MEPVGPAELGRLQGLTEGGAWAGSAGFQKYLEEELRLANKSEVGCERGGTGRQEGSWSELWEDDSPPVSSRPAAAAKDKHSAGTCWG